MVAYAGVLPFSGRRAMQLQHPGLPVYQVATNEVSPNYFAAMGIPVLRGRALQESDVVNGPTAQRVVVSTEFVRQFFSGQDPLGKTLRTLEGAVMEIAGVVRDTAVQQ